MNKKVYESPSINVIELQSSSIMAGSMAANSVSESDDGISITLGDDMEYGSATSARAGRYSSAWDDEE